MPPPCSETALPPDGGSGTRGWDVGGSGTGGPATEPADPESAETAREAVALARAAAECWSKVPLHRRLVLLRKARHRIAARAGSLAVAGKEAGTADGTAARCETLASEVLPLLDACRFLEREARGILAPRRPGWRGRPLWLWGVDLEIFREPLGVVLIIGPSNYPLFLPGVQIVQALAAGNSVILKPGEGGTPVAKVLQSCLVDSGLDGRLFQILPEPAAAAREAFRAGVDKVLLTGSARTGASVLADLAPRIIPAALELSGCDAVFVLSGADLELVAKAIAFGLRWNASETCIAPRRLFVSPAAEVSLSARLEALAKEIPPRPTRPQARKLAMELISEAISRGAKVVAGGFELPDGTGLAPTVLSGVTAEMRLAREDIFAPVVCLLTARDEEEALRLAGACPYALGASIFGEESAARALARRVQAGVVVVNDVIVPTADPRLPFGGRGRSGYGVTRGAEGLLELTRVKAVAVRRRKFHRHMEELQPQDEEILGSYLRAAHGGTLRERLSATATLVKSLRKRLSCRQKGS